MSAAGMKIIQGVNVDKNTRITPTPFLTLIYLVQISLTRLFKRFLFLIEQKFLYYHEFRLMLY